MGYGKVSVTQWGGKISDTKGGGVRWECDGVQGGGRKGRKGDGGMGCV